MLKPIIRPYRWYGAAELEIMLGRKLADECAPLATIRGRYWGGTIIHYLDEIGRQRVESLLHPKTSIDLKPVRMKQKKHDPANSGKNRSRYYKDPE